MRILWRIFTLNLLIQQEHEVEGENARTDSQMDFNIMVILCIVTGESNELIITYQILFIIFIATGYYWKQIYIYTYQYNIYTNTYIIFTLAYTHIYLYLYIYIYIYIIIIYIGGNISLKMLKALCKTKIWRQNSLYTRFLEIIVKFNIRKFNLIYPLSKFND